MPIYQYKCHACKTEFEELLSWKKSQLEQLPCPNCGELNSKNDMYIGVTHVHFRGEFTDLGKLQEKNKQLRNKWN